MVPLIQKQLDTFGTTIWNIHRIRTQKQTLLPSGVPNYIFDFPEEYGLEECGWCCKPVLMPLAIRKGLLTWVYIIFSNNISYSNLVIFYYLGLPVTEEQLHEVGIESGVLNIAEETPEFPEK